jgi:cobyrinic acid a,c-diamide synthase
MPSNEAVEARAKIDTIASLIAASVDLDRLLAVAANVPAFNTPTVLPATAAASASDVRIGIARDAAFAFYYPGDLEALRAAGAELVPIDTLKDKKLPEVDALLIGGGFPEVFMEQLEANSSLRHQIRLAIETGLPAYAECGGLMYLARSLSWNGKRCEMAGVIPGDVVMHERPMGRGYVVLRETGKNPWPAPAAAQAPAEIRAHEFHYSTLENLAPDTVYAYEVLRGTGIDGRHDGIVHKNLFACYAHLRDLENNHWTIRFVEFVRQRRQAGARQKQAH